MAEGRTQLKEEKRQYLTAHPDITLQEGAGIQETIEIYFLILQIINSKQTQLIFLIDLNRQTKYK